MIKTRAKNRGLGDCRRLKNTPKKKKKKKNTRKVNKTLRSAAYWRVLLCHLRFVMLDRDEWTLSVVFFRVFYCPPLIPSIYFMDYSKPSCHGPVTLTSSHQTNKWPHQWVRQQDCALNLSQWVGLRVCTMKSNKVFQFKSSFFTVQLVEVNKTL